MAAGSSGAEICDLTGLASDDEEGVDDALQRELSDVTNELERVEAQLQALVEQRASLRQRQAALKQGLKGAAAARASARAGTDWQRAAFAHDVNVQRVLRDVFKLPGFRGLQRGVVNATLSGVDCLVLLPAGGAHRLRAAQRPRDSIDSRAPRLPNLAQAASLSPISFQPSWRRRASHSSSLRWFHLSTTRSWRCGLSACMLRS